VLAMGANASGFRLLNRKKFLYLDCGGVEMWYVWIDDIGIMHVTDEKSPYFAYVLFGTYGSQSAAEEAIDNYAAQLEYMEPNA